jgi:opacity protein-like surface antigen
MTRAVAAALLLCGAAAAAAAQTVPRLGSEAPLGAAGIGAVQVQPGPFTANPAEAVLAHGWAVGLTSVRAGAIGVAEHAGSARARLGPVAVGVQVAQRSVDDLFEDPVLQQSGLGVHETDLTAAFAVPLRRWLAAGIAGSATWTGVLGSEGAGTGARVGVRASLGAWALGAWHGVLGPSQRWTTSTGERFATAQATRTALALRVRALERGAVVPIVAAEFDADGGSQAVRWLRASACLDFAARLAACGGAASTTEWSAGPRFAELGIRFTTGRFAVSLGQRFGTEPAPGNAFGLSVGYTSAR